MGDDGEACNKDKAPWEAELEGARESVSQQISRGEWEFQMGIDNHTPMSLNK